MGSLNKEKDTDPLIPIILFFLPRVVLSCCQQKIEWMWVLCSNSLKCRIPPVSSSSWLAKMKSAEETVVVTHAGNHLARPFVVLLLDKLLFCLPESQYSHMKQEWCKKLSLESLEGATQNCGNSFNNLLQYEFSWGYFQSDLNQEQSCTQGFLCLKNFKIIFVMAKLLLGQLPPKMLALSEKRGRHQGRNKQLGDICWVWSCYQEQASMPQPEDFPPKWARRALCSSSSLYLSGDTQELYQTNCSQNDCIRIVRHIQWVIKAELVQLSPSC